jgi:hypothetical protein
MRRQWRVCILKFHGVLGVSAMNDKTYITLLSGAIDVYNNLKSDEEKTEKINKIKKTYLWGPFGSILVGLTECDDAKRKKITTFLFHNFPDLAPYIDDGCLEYIDKKKMHAEVYDLLTPAWKNQFTYKAQDYYRDEMAQLEVQVRKLQSDLIKKSIGVQRDVDGFNAFNRYLEHQGKLLSIKANSEDRPLIKAQYNHGKTVIATIVDNTKDKTKRMITDANECIKKANVSFKIARDVISHLKGVMLKGESFHPNKYQSLRQEAIYAQTNQQEAVDKIKGIEKQCGARAVLHEIVSQLEKVITKNTFLYSSKEEKKDALLDLRSKLLGLSSKIEIRKNGKSLTRSGKSSLELVDIKNVIENWKDEKLGSKSKMEIINEKRNFLFFKARCKKSTSQRFIENALKKCGGTINDINVSKPGMGT